jgi:hypothetical protein
MTLSPQRALAIIDLTATYEVRKPEASGQFRTLEKRVSGVELMLMIDAQTVEIIGNRSRITRALMVCDEAEVKHRMEIRKQQRAAELKAESGEETDGRFNNQASKTVERVYWDRFNAPGSWMWQFCA